MRLYARLTVVLWLILFSVTAFEYFLDFPLHWWRNDTYELMAQIRLLSEGIAGGESAPVGYSVVVALGVIHSVLTIDPLTMLYAVGLLNTALFIGSSRLFLMCHFPERETLLIQTSMLFFWGFSSPWAGIYAITDSYNLFSPQSLGYSLLFLSLYFLTMKKYREFSVSAAILLTAHLLTGALLVLLTVVHSVIGRDPRAPKYLVLGIAIACVLPMASLISILSYHGGIHDFGMEKTRLPLSLAIDTFLSQFGVGLIGLLGIYLLLRQKRYLFPAWYAAMALMFFFPVALPNRFLYLSGIPLHVGCGHLLSRLNKKHLGVALLVLMMISLHFLYLRAERINQQPVPPFLGIIEEHTQQDAVILTERGVVLPRYKGTYHEEYPHKAYFPIYGYTGRRSLGEDLSLFHFFSEEEQLQFFRENGVTHMLLFPQFANATPKTDFQTLYDDGEMRLLELD